MSEINEGFKLGNAVMDLASKILGPSFTQRQAKADAQSALQGAMARQLAAYIEEFPSNPDVLDEIISCGGKMNLINLAKIVQMASFQLNETATPALITDDWTANYKEKARTCSDEEMAKLWAQLLASEANAPGSYSRKMANVLADMDAHDAKSFSNLCRFQLMDMDSRHGRILVIRQHGFHIYEEYGVTADVVYTLQNLGLITFGGNPETNGDLDVILSTALLGYSDGILSFKYVDDSKINGPTELRYGQVTKFQGQVNIGAVNLTKSGMELSNLCLPLNTPKEFVDWLIQTWGGFGTNCIVTKQDWAVRNPDGGIIHIHPDIGRMIGPHDEQPAPSSCWCCSHNNIPSHHWNKEKPLNE